MIKRITELISFMVKEFTSIKSNWVNFETT